MLGPGTVIAKYVILNPLHTGERAMVYRARDMVAQSDVALKLFVGELQSASALKSSLEREFMARQFQHAGAVPAREIVVHNRTLGIASQLVDGTSLRGMMDQERPGPWRPTETLNLLKPVMEMMAGAHGAGIIHGNIT
ncbi:MAG: hypothetical protein KDA28_11310, partial [Phycisphaerales bacterium]|nr:hypothetical protein [Phycisphaerales bacterium]